MTVTITEHITTVAGTPDSTPWVFSTVIRESGGTVITGKEVRVRPVDGTLVVELEPGPATVTFGNQAFAFTVPEHDSELWPLLAEAVPPGTPADAIAAAVAAHLQNHPILAAVDDITDATTVGKAVLTAADEAAARSAIGAGTSNLALGTTDSTAKAGDYQPVWSDVTSKPSTFPPAIGSGADQAVAGNDSRLSDARTPTAHGHTAADISDFSTAADARVSAGITGKLDTSAAPELIRDTLAAALVAGSNVTITPNGGADTITISAAGGSLTLNGDGFWEVVSGLTLNGDGFWEVA